jgi:hypothetical protein
MVDAACRMQCKRCHKLMDASSFFDHVNTSRSCQDSGEGEREGCVDDAENEVSDEEERKGKRVQVRFRRSIVVRLQQEQKGSCSRQPRKPFET